MEKNIIDTLMGCPVIEKEVTIRACLECNRGGVGKCAGKGDEVEKEFGKYLPGAKKKVEIKAIKTPEHKVCRVPNCKAKVASDGFCMPHYAWRYTHVGRERLAELGIEIPLKNPIRVKKKQKKYQKMKEKNIMKKQKVVKGSSASYCSVDGCTEDVHARGLCKSHYDQGRKHKSVQEKQKPSGSDVYIVLGKGGHSVVDLEGLKKMYREGKFTPDYRLFLGKEIEVDWKPIIKKKGG